jgi:hypothetical protein
MHEALDSLETIVPRLDEAGSSPQGSECQLELAQLVDVLCALVALLGIADVPYSGIAVVD